MTGSEWILGGLAAVALLYIPVRALWSAAQAVARIELQVTNHIPSSIAKLNTSMSDVKDRVTRLESLADMKTRASMLENQ